MSTRSIGCFWFVREFHGAAMWTRLLLTSLAAILIGVTALRPSPSTHPPTETPAGARDVDTFWAVSVRMRAGESYYDAFGDELRERGYPTRSVFNWRTPLLLTAVATVPAAISQGILLALGITLCIATFVVLKPPLAAAAALTMQLGIAAMIGVAPAVVLGEAWAGPLIALSLCAYLAQRERLAVGLGMTALFLRELAVVYCAVCASVAAIESVPARRAADADLATDRSVSRRRRELAAWIVGGVLYGAYFTWHAMQVAAHRQPTDLDHVASWLQFGGVSFLLATARWHAWSLVLPGWSTAVILLVVVAGIIDSGTPRPVRLTSAAYLVFFLAVGQPFNDYWGLIAWPAWALAFGCGVHAMAQWPSAVRKSGLIMRRT